MSLLSADLTCLGVVAATRTHQVLASDPASVSDASSTHSLRQDPESAALFLPEDPRCPWEAVYALKAPGGGSMMWVSAYALIQGRTPAESEDDCPALVSIADNPAGPWRVVGERSIWTHAKGWHFGLFGEGRFSGDENVGYVKFSARKGVRGFRLAGHYTPRMDAPAGTPLVIEHI
ncbi:MAG: hypothetical protein HN712_14390 [Gemmatimonadetes bacterium]|nr:hypothetical protein [Gemmatimonadota bacterium]MBT7861508.1 hypothetical protein [Gemmatimonadota bacterium]